MNTKNTKNTATSKSASALAAEFVNTVGALAAAKFVRRITPQKPATCATTTVKGKAKEEDFFTEAIDLLRSCRKQLDALLERIPNANAANPPTAAATPKAAANHAAISAVKTGKTVPPKTWKEALKAYAAAHPKKTSDDVFAACAKLYPALHAATIKPMTEQAASKTKTTSTRSK